MLAKRTVWNGQVLNSKVSCLSSWSGEKPHFFDNDRLQARTVRGNLHEVWAETSRLYVMPIFSEVFSPRLVGKNPNFTLQKAYVMVLDD